MKVMLRVAGCLLLFLSGLCEGRLMKYLAAPSQDKDDLASEAVQHAAHGDGKAPASKEQKDFAALDADGNGYLSEREVAMKQLARASGNERLASRRAQDYVSCADLNKDGKIGLEEYKETVPGVGYTNWYNCVKDKEAPYHAFFAFEDCDSNKDHQLDIHELHNSFVKSWGTAAADLVSPFLECCDNDDNGSLSEHEFAGCGGHYNPATGSWELVGSVQWLCMEPAFQDYDQRMRFDTIDTSGDHLISKQESYDFISSLGCVMSMKDADALFAAADINQDHMIDYAEFKKAGENHNGPDGQSTFFLAKNLKLQHQLVEVAWVDPPFWNADDFNDI